MNHQGPQERSAGSACLIKKEATAMPRPRQGAEQEAAVEEGKWRIMRSGVSCSRGFMSLFMFTLIMCEDSA